MVDKLKNDEQPEIAEVDSFDFESRFGDLRGLMHGSFDAFALLEVLKELYKNEPEKTQEQIPPYIISMLTKRKTTFDNTTEVNEFYDEIRVYNDVIDTFGLWALFDGTSFYFNEFDHTKLDIFKKLNTEKITLKIEDGMDPEEVRMLVEGVDLSKFKEVRLNLNSVENINDYVELFSFLTHLRINSDSYPIRAEIVNSDMKRLTNLNIDGAFTAEFLNSISECQFGNITRMELRCSGFSEYSLMNLMNKNPDLEYLHISATIPLDEEILLSKVELTRINNLHVSGRIGNIDKIVNSNLIKCFYFDNGDGSDISQPFDDDVLLELIREGYLDNVESFSLSNSYLTDTSFVEIINKLDKLKVLIVASNEIDFENIRFNLLPIRCDIDELDIGGNFISPSKLAEFRESKFVEGISKYHDNDQQN